MKLHYKIDMDPRSKWVIADAAQTGLYVQEIGDFRAGKTYFTEREGLGSYLLKYTVSGRGVLEYDGETHLLEPGQFFLIDCRARQRYYTDPKTGSWHVLWVHFYGEDADALYQRFLVCGSGSVGTLGLNSPVSEELCQLLRSCEESSTAASDLRQQGLLQLILSQCIDCASVNAGGSSRYVGLARDYIAAHFAETITLEKLGRLANVSGYYLQRLFRHQYGVSPLEYQRRLRLTYAKELLRSTELSISEIAAKAGFSGAGYLIRFFRMQDGVTPAAYRRQWREQ